MDESNNQPEAPRLNLRPAGGDAEAAAPTDDGSPGAVVSASGKLKISGKRKIVEGATSARSATHPPIAPAPSLSKSLKQPSDAPPARSAPPAGSAPAAGPAVDEAETGGAVPKLPARLAQAKAETMAAPFAPAPAKKLDLKTPGYGAPARPAAATPPPADSRTVAHPSAAAATRSASSGTAILGFMLLLIAGSVGGAGYLVWKKYGGTLDSIPYLSEWVAPKPYSGPPKAGAVAFARNLLDGIGGGTGGSYAAVSASPAGISSGVRAAPAAPRPAGGSATVQGVTATTAAPIRVRPSNEMSAADRARMQSISSWLQGVHIGAVKATGAHRVMINSESYDIGETVNAEFSLQFAGVRDGKLLFRDANDFLYMKRF